MKCKFILGTICNHMAMKVTDGYYLTKITITHRIHIILWVLLFNKPFIYMTSKYNQ